MFSYLYSHKFKLYVRLKHIVLWYENLLEGCLSKKLLVYIAWSIIKITYPSQMCLLVGNKKKYCFDSC